MSRKRRHEEHEEHPDESWLLPYADMLTLLLALFIVLYSMNTVDTKKFEEMSQAFNIVLNSGGGASGVLDFPNMVETGVNVEWNDTDEEGKEDPKGANNAGALEELIKQEQAELEDLKKMIDAYIEENGLTSDLETKLNLTQLVIFISDNALFDPAQAEVKPDSRGLATAIGTMLQQYPAYEIIVSGHTDTVPINNASFKSNWDLSAMRAVRFMDIMLQNKDLNPERFMAIGYGEYRPIGDNSTSEGRTKNRRVEISIIHTYVDTTNPQLLDVPK